MVENKKLININVMKRYRIILGLFALMFVINACNKDDIDLYNSNDTAINFPGSADNFANATYDTKTQTFLQNFSFLDSIGNDYAIITIPTKIVGDVASYDREISYKINTDSTTATESDYEILSSIVPADSMYGAIKVKVKYDTSLQTEEKVLFLELTSSKDFKRGTNEYNLCQFTWSDKLLMPTDTRSAMSYNMLIENPNAWYSRSFSCYSPNAHKLIMIVLETNHIPTYVESPYMIYPNRGAWAAKINQYLEKWDEEHPDEPWIHDAGDLKGEKIYARGYGE